MEYRLDIVVVLLRAFVDKHNVDLNGTTANENMYIMATAAAKAGDDGEEVLDFLDFIAEKDLIESVLKPGRRVKCAHFLIT
jgi:hypothetical protein